MDSWVLKAMERWPNVPVLFGWLGLDRRGRWLIKREPITHPRIVATINRNYGVDEHGRWFFQNGPQRGYVEFDYAPYVLRVEDEGFTTHNGLRVTHPERMFLDETGTLGVATEYGFGEIAGTDLEWLLERMKIRGAPLSEDALATLLEGPSNAPTETVLELGKTIIPIVRLDANDLPQRFGFVRKPQPLAGERVSTHAPD